MDRNINEHRIFLLSTAAMFAALVCIGSIIAIPTPFGGNVNLSDCFILLGAWILGPVYGALGAAIGSALGDLFSGYFLYVPGTFVIKGLIALSAAMIAKRMTKQNVKSRTFTYIISALAAEIIMILGYFIYEMTVVGYGVYGASLNIMYNAIQGAFGAIFSVIFIKIIIRTKVLSKYISF